MKFTNQADNECWLKEAIPHRIRACLAITERLGDRLGVLPNWPVRSETDRVARRCETDAIWEGRLVAMRWLIELVGLTRDKHGNPIAKQRKSSNQDDVLLVDLPDGELIPPNHPDAQTLAAVWKGSTQGSSHPTHNTGHPKVNERELEAALDVIIRHLNETVYKAFGMDVLTVALDGKRPTGRQG